MWMAKSYDPSSIPDVQAVFTQTRPAINALHPQVPDGFM
jgi:hypothetical protein